jgi:hypothetical protein
MTDQSRSPRSVRWASALSALAIGGLLAVSATAHAGTDPYRRWADDGKTYECVDVGEGVIHVNLSNQNTEFDALPADAQFTINYVKNGTNTPTGPYTVEQTSGTHNYSAFQIDFAAYPLVFDFRVDTIVQGVVVYRSTLHIACTGDAQGNVSPINEVVVPLPPTGGSPTVLLWAGVLVVAGGLTVVATRGRRHA